MGAGDPELVESCSACVVKRSLSGVFKRDPIQNERCRMVTVTVAVLGVIAMTALMTAFVWVFCFEYGERVPPKSGL